MDFGSTHVNVNFLWQIRQEHMYKVIAFVLMSLGLQSVYKLECSDLIFEDEKCSVVDPKVAMT